jgi:hypothetical protein
MHKAYLLAACLTIGMTGAAASAATISDPVGDFLGSYTGPHEADLDVASFSVNYDAATQNFLLKTILAGPVDTSTPGVYVYGVDTGTGASAPFGPIGEGNVRFDQVILVQKDGSALVPGFGALAAGSTKIDGKELDLTVPLSALPSTGFDPQHYGFNLWPRDSGTGGFETISDFAPQNALLSAVPEPATWMSMIGGLAITGALFRRRRDRMETAAIA